MKVVINKCYGGFDLSNQAQELYYKKKYNKKLYFYKSEIKDKDFIYIKASPEDKYSSIASELDNLDAISRLESYKYHFYTHNLKRDDNFLVEVVEELNHNANGVFAKLAVIEIPDDIDWYIDNYDGAEIVREKHKTWE